MIKKCRVCDNTNLIPCLDIGEQYLSSIFPESLEYRSNLKKHSLALVLCQKNNSPYYCGLLQLANKYDLSAMYKEYPYTSSSNQSMKTILEKVVQNATSLNVLEARDLILDIGGNDGTLLSFFKDSDYELLNIDPAKNVKSIFKSPYYKKTIGFFNKELFDSISGVKAKLIFSIAMFYHLDNPYSFCYDVANCLDNNGIWLVQMAYLPAMLKTYMYDNIVHEHNGYYGIETMEWIINKVGLEIFDVEINDVYGGSFCLFIKKVGNNRFPKTERLKKALEEEKECKIFDISTYHNFIKHINKEREELHKLLVLLKLQNKKVWIYGASTKGNTITQYCDLNTKVIKAAADCNPFKFNKYLIGCDIEIKSEEEMRYDKPDYLLVLPYSFTNDFRTKEKDLIKQGTKFIVPLPKVKIL